MAKRPKDVEGRPELPPGARRRGKSIQVRVYRGYDAATGRRLQATETVATPEEAWEERRRLYPLFLTAIHTGMRMGELSGLRWEDVDLEAGVAWVRQTLEKPGNQPVFGTPKNRRFRDVPLTAQVLEALRALRVDQELERAAFGPDYRDYGLVFCQPDGRPIDEKSLNRNAWKQIRAAAGLPEKVRLHDLRHTFVSRALAAGKNPRAVSDLVGHHDPGFTLRRYAHALPSDRREVVEGLADYLDQAREDPES